MVAIYSPEAVFNQSPPLENYNLFDSDCALKEAVHREGGGWIDAEAHKLGELSANRRLSISVYWQIGLPRSCEPMIDAVIGSTRSPIIRRTTS